MNDKLNMENFHNDSLKRDLIVGSLLGDGNLQTETKGRTWRYRALQKAEHRAYLEHKYAIIADMCSSPPIYGEVLDERTGKIAKRWYFNSKVDSSLRYYGNLFYREDPETGRMVKDVPKNIKQLLTPRAIAFWYMDDGSIKWLGHSNAMRICTESFSTEGVKRLQKALENSFNIKTNLVRKTRDNVFIGYDLAINEPNSTAFRELIRPYLVDCMRYKVSDGKRGHL